MTKRWNPVCWMVCKWWFPPSTLLNVVGKINEYARSLCDPTLKEGTGEGCSKDV